MWKEWFTRNAPDKIIAVCWGSAACSLALLLAWLLRIPERTGSVILDDWLFGSRRPWFWVVYLADLLLQPAIILLLQARRWRIGLSLGIAWTAVLLSESALDLPAFADDPHMLSEELFFCGLYFYLMILLVVCYSRLRRAP